MMSAQNAGRSLTEAQSEMIRWSAGLGAVTAEALAAHDRPSLASARGRLAAAERRAHMCAWRLLQGQQTIYTVTRRGLASAGTTGIEPARVGPAGARHAIACCKAAVVLERDFPELLVLGEPAIRRHEREVSGPLAVMGRINSASAAKVRHRPDLLLVDPRDPRKRPVAVEIELSVKSRARLAEICLAWSRSRVVSGVIYFAAPEVIAPLTRAIEAARGGGRVLALSFDALAIVPVTSQTPKTATCSASP